MSFSSKRRSREHVYEGKYDRDTKWRDSLCCSEVQPTARSDQGSEKQIDSNNHSWNSFWNQNMSANTTFTTANIDDMYVKECQESQNDGFASYARKNESEPHVHIVPAYFQSSSLWFSSRASWQLALSSHREAKYEYITPSSRVLVCFLSKLVLSKLVLFESKSNVRFQLFRTPRKRRLYSWELIGNHMLYFSTGRWRAQYTSSRYSNIFETRNTKDLTMSQIVAYTTWKAHKRGIYRNIRQGFRNT